MEAGVAVRMRVQIGREHKREVSVRGWVHVRCKDNDGEVEGEGSRVSVSVRVTNMSVRVA
jgi:hypothetical protein